MLRKTIITFLLVLAMMILPKVSFAFEKDAHYYLKFMLALRICCYSWNEAWTIASADLAVDTNTTTTAHVMDAIPGTPGGDEEIDRRQTYHAFDAIDPDTGEYTGTYYNAKEFHQNRITGETDYKKKLAKLGQYLHFLEDVRSHGLYPAAGLAHGVDTLIGQDPDSLADPIATGNMIDDTLNALNWGCLQIPAPLECLQTLRVQGDVNAIRNSLGFLWMEDSIVNNSSPLWRHVLNFDFVPGLCDAIAAIEPQTLKTIIARNRAVIESYIRAFFSENPEFYAKKCAPQNLTIPDPMEIKYDVNGEPIKIGDQEYSLLIVNDTDNPAFSVDPATYQSDLVISRVNVNPVSPTQVNVVIQVSNIGSSGSLAGTVKATSADFDTQTFIGESSVPISSVGACATAAITIPLATSPLYDRPFFTVDLMVDDKDASNNSFTGRIGDLDNDLALDASDNCLYSYNPDQADNESDGVGNVCDNCPNNYNPNQADGDYNNIGDVCEYSGRRSCFLGGTSILMANGSTKPIEKIKIGDEVMAFNEATGKFIKDKVKEVFTHEADSYLVINGNLKVTPNHPVYSVGKWVEIGNLKIGDELFDSKGSSLVIASKKGVKEKVKVYNLEVNPYHTYIAEGVVVHNKLGPFEMRIIEEDY